MPILNCYVSDEDFKYLQEEAADRGRTPEDLAECAISETILQATKHRRHNPDRDYSSKNPA